MRKLRWRRWKGTGSLQENEIMKFAIPYPLCHLLPAEKGMCARLALHLECQQHSLNKFLCFVFLRAGILIPALRDIFVEKLRRRRSARG